jgi:hypothetical protein
MKISQIEEAEMKYRVEHTCDESGGRYPGSIIDQETDILEEAIALADERTARGQCGFVRRADGAILAPDGSWLKQDGN